MSLEENKAIVRRYTEELNKRNLAIIDELIAPDYFTFVGYPLQGREEFKQFITMLFNVIPDWHETIEDIIAEGDKVWYRIKITGTHTGEYRGYLPLIGKKVRVAPTGKKFTMMEVSIKRIVNGKIVESWGVYDNLDFYKQVGVIEYKELPEDVS